LMGFAATGVRLEELVAAALSYIVEPHIRATLYDVTDGEAGQALSWVPRGGGVGQIAPVSENLRLTHEFDVAGRRWQVSTFALPSFLDAETGWQSWPPLVFAIGALISGLVAMALWALLRQAALQRRLALERAETNRALE